MSENPLQVLVQTFEKVSYSIQHHLTRFIGLHLQPVSSAKAPLFSISSSPHKFQSAKADSFVQPDDILLKIKSAATPVTKEELGRATWTFLHTLAAQTSQQRGLFSQYPDNPTRQQKKDVKELMGILSRMYPCKECADHFKEVLRANPVQAGSQAEFSQWLCHVHNVVNRRNSKRDVELQREFK
ncbi:FAD-linked sulfhydryl oxidase ERV1 isoform X3 [Neltuma alba]|uniref:FAD-linked sulfhydryl oxidase ERV1 isoform X3 n=1 Tax=Neltuma alba TaxID=207710 RepID=UPI0010A4542D|nr:FAD-linked sulfhydryl oxidase ERV1-like isoform X3 [Prosopis alba]